MIKIRETIEKHMRHGNSDWTWECTTGELIRCKDCVHYPYRTVSFAENIPIDTVYQHCFIMGADGYCSKAERKEEHE